MKAGSFIPYSRKADMRAYDRLSHAERFMQRYDCLPDRHVWSRQQFAQELALANDGNDKAVIGKLRRIELRRIGLDIPA